VRLPSPPPSRRWGSTTTHHAPGFYDLLSSSGIGIGLTKRALQEFDRRNASETRQEPLEKLPFKDPLPDIKRFARHGGPDLSDVIGVSHPRQASLLVLTMQQYPETASIEMTYSRSKAQSASKRQQRKSKAVAVNTGRVTKSSTKKTKSGRSSAYNADFMNLLISNGIDRPQRINKPANYDQLRDRLAQRRGSLSPSTFPETNHENFLDAVENAFNEAQVMSDVFPAIKGPKIYPSTTNRPCYNWAPLVTADLVAPQPDFFDGARQSAEDSELRQALNSLIVPSTSSDAPFLPNFLAEAKPPGGSAEVARRQAVYDGAFGARAMHYLQAYGAEEIYDGNAYTLTSTYSDGKLEIFSHHMTQPSSPEKPPHHHTVSIGRWLLDQDVQSFRVGAAAFRNVRDLAREIRGRFIADANRRMDLFPPEVRRRKLAEAFQKTEEILKKNSFKEPSLSAPSQSAGDLKSLTSLNKSAGDDTDRVVTPLGKVKNRAACKERRARKLPRTKKKSS